MDHQLLEGYNQLHYEGKGSHVDEELRVLYQITGQESTLSVDTESAWQQFADQVSPPTIERSISYRWVRVAAIILIGCCLSVASYFFIDTSNMGPKMVTIENAASTIQSHALPDGSIVWLRQGAILSYTQDFEGRSLVFEGEGYFEVEKGNGKFTISTGDGLEIVVLGTEFGVNTTTTNTIVRVTEGVVSMSAENSNQAINAGETGVYYRARQRVLKSNEDLTNALAWKTGHFKFSDITLAEAIELLESFYPSKVVLKNPALGNCRVNGEFNDQSLSDILRDLSLVLSLDVATADNSFILSGEGC